MLLAIDIGNTNIVLGIWNGADWLLQWRLSTVRDRTADEYGVFLKGLLRERKLKKAVKQVVLSSVVPRLTTTFVEAVQRYLACEPLVVRHDIELGIQICTDFPEQVGADRLVNAAAAYHITHTACIVVDMGTATKLDVVNQQGKFLGGIISPGLQITADALFARAAKLSQVDFVAPPAVIGRNTIHALQSGLILGYSAQIEGLIPQIEAELHQLDPTLTRPVPVIGTGGLISVLAQHLPRITTIDPWLTLKGLQYIASLNQG